MPKMTPLGAFIFLLKSGHTENHLATAKGLQHISELLRQLRERTHKCESHLEQMSQYVLDEHIPFPHVAAGPWAVFSEVLMQAVQSLMNLVMEHLFVGPSVS